MSQWKVLGFVAGELEGSIVTASSAAALAAVEETAEALGMAPVAAEAAALAVLVQGVGAGRLREVFDAAAVAVYEELRPGHHWTVADRAAAMHGRSAADAVRWDAAIATLAGEAAACGAADRDSLADRLATLAERERDRDRADWLVVLASRLRGRADRAEVGAAPPGSFLISISVDICDSTRAKARMRARAGDEDELSGWYEDFQRQFLTEEFRFYEDLLDGSLGDARWDWDRLFVVKGIGDEVWVLYEVAPEDGWKVGSLVALLLDAALGLVENRTARWSWHERGESAGGASERREYPFKVYADVVEGAHEVSAQRRDHAARTAGEILGAEYGARDLVELGNRLNAGVLMRDLRRTLAVVRSDYIGWEVDRFFRASKSAMACVVTVGQGLVDRIDAPGWDAAAPVAGTDLRRLAIECPLAPGGRATRNRDGYLALRRGLDETKDLKGVGEGYVVYHVVAETGLMAMHRDRGLESALGGPLEDTRRTFTRDMADAVAAERAARAGG